MLKTVYDVTQVDGSVLLILLVGPPLNSGLVKVLLLEGAQERIYLLLDLVVLILIDPLNATNIVVGLDFNMWLGTFLLILLDQV